MKKISVMIVDDEKLAIEDLKTIVDWNNLGYEIVATAVNGRQALSKFQHYRPQVVITDIKMPFMDGIELIKHIREIDDKVLILLLTAYEDFSYAKSAIKYGITDYIIKYEINNESFTNLLYKLRDNIYTQSRNIYVLNDKMISDYLLSSNGKEIENDNELFHTPYFYLIVEQDLPLSLIADNYIQNISCKKTDVISVLTSKEGENYKIVATGSTPNDQILVVLDIREISQCKINQAIKSCATEKKMQLEKQLQREFTFYLIKRKVTLIDLKRLLFYNSQVFKEKYITGCSSIYDFDEIKPVKRIQQVTFDSSAINELVNQLNAKELRDYLSELFLSIRDFGSYRYLCEVNHELYNILIREFKTLPDFIDKPNLSMSANWKSWLDAQELLKWFLDNFDILIKSKKELSRHAYSKSVLHTIDYIHQNYKDSAMTLNKIADNIHLSTGHLCALFKKETGKTLNNYITEVRISEAKRLLNEGKLKVYEISSEVGYQSSQYFSQVFYKQAGIYPTEYQKGKRP